MDPFGALPAPILEMILELLDNLLSLHNLHDASPVVALLLHEDGVAPPIFEAIMSRSIPKQILVLIRWTALIQWKCPNDDAPAFFSSWEAFGAYMRNVELYMVVKDYACGRDHLPKSTPPSVLCRIHQMAVRVRLLAHQCMHKMIDRCMALEPSRLQKGLKFQYLRYSSFSNRKPREYRPAQIPPGEQYQLVDAGPPSWVEEQRVCRAIWRLIMFLKLRDAVIGTKTKKTRWNWSEDNIHRLQSLQYDDFWRPFIPFRTCQIHELKTVAEYLFSSISMTPQTEQYQYPSFLSTIPTEFSRVCCRCPPTFKSKPASEETWGQSKRDVNSAAPGFSFVSHNLGTMPKSPLRYIEFRVFRRFGGGTGTFAYPR
ncbi:hypothetical protein M432DRAFT_550535 [Thermoascus aurantiacus ATCC 26904]